jgi:hypothetical protein
MMKKPIGVVLCLITFAVAAQYKCVDNKGNTTFQQTPCSAAEKEQKIRVFAGEAPKPAPAVPVAPPTLTPDQRILAKLERDRRLEDRARNIDNLDGQINYLQDVINRRNTQMTAELAALQNKKAYARNNLAGATWEQSISTEMQAVTQKYKTMNDADFERLRLLRTDLEAAKAAKQ